MGMLDDLRQMQLGECAIRMPSEDADWRLCPVGQMLSEAVAVRIQNVADYFFTETVVGDWRTARDFPNLAPPWPVAWYEYRMPAVWRRRVGLRPYARAGAHVGVLATSCEADDGWQLLLWVFWRPPHGREWCLIVPYMWLAIAPDGQPQIRDSWVDPEGNTRFAVVGGAVDLRTGAPLVAGHPLTPPIDEDGLDGELRLMAYAMKPALLAITFAHCRNVAIVSDPSPPVRLAHAQLKRHGTPKVVYRTLQIEAATRLVEAERQAAGVSAPRALHIARGHFADYRQGGGLFGRYRGLVWRPMHVRGRDHARIVVKDYAVAAPTSEAR